MIFGSNRKLSSAIDSNRGSTAIDSIRLQSAAIAKSMAIGGIRVLSVAIALNAIADEPFLGGFVSAVSADSAAVRLEARSMSFVAPRVVAGTQNLVSSNGLTVTAWDTTTLANGWHEVTEPTGGGEKAQLLVANLPSIAVEGGRLQSNATWTSNAVHWVRNRVIVPSGVTLTVAAGAVVKFGEQTGMFVEDGGTVKFNGNSSAQVVLTSFADDVHGGDSDFGATNAVWNSWSLTAQSGGTISDFYTEVRYGTVGSFPTLSMPGAVTASRTTGKARVSVSFDTAPTKRAALTWRTVDGTAKYGVDFTQNSGTAVWVSGTTVYFDIPLVNLEDVQEVRTFTIELVTVEGANANPSRLKTTVSITGGDGAVDMPTCAESEESEAIRLEARDPDPKPEPVPATLAIEGGRLPSNAIWDSTATNFVLNTVVIPSGVTLTVVTNAVVYFTPNTGIKVEPGGALRVVGSAEGPALFTAATKGDWSLAVVSGGTFTDSYAIFEKTTISQHPTVTVPNGVEVSEKDGEVRVSVAVSGDRSSAFRVKWRAVDGTAKFGEDYTLASGEVEWTGTSQGTKYITIPISNDDVEEESETFTVELFDAQGANIGGSYRCTVLVRDGTAALVPLATCVESEESAAIRLETRDPDPKPEVVDSSIAIEGGRLLSSAIWDSTVTNFVLNTVVIPSGVTLTVVTNAVVYFTPYTGIKVEPGGALMCVGSQDGPVVFEAANDGDYTINVVSGGTFTDTWTGFRNLNYGGFGTASLDGSLVVDADEGVMQIPVYISGSRTSLFSVDWEGSDGTTGTIVWNNANEGKKWIELPIEGRTEGFSLRLVEGRGINISDTAHEIAVKVFTSAAPKAVCAESEESAAVRFECRAEGTLGRALVCGTEYISADGETRAVAWDSTQVADGWQANGTLVRNSQSMAIECGRLQSNVTWSNDVTHLVRSWVIVPSGVTLRIEAGTVVKFCELTGFKVEQGGTLIVAGTEESPVVYTAAADDTIGGDSDLREATPNDGDYGVNIVSGGTYTDSNCAVRYTTFSNLGTATMTANALAALTDGIVRIPVTISTDRTTKFCVDWRTGGSRSCATASGRITWNSKNDGTKYIELPLVSGSLTNEFDTFTVELYESQGINISTTARRCDVTIYSNDCFPQGAYAESGESDAVRFETREYDSDLEIESSELIAIEGGRLQANTTWSNNVTHLVRQWVVVPGGVTLTIQAGTVVKFLPYTGIKVEQGGRVNANGTAANNIIFTSVADDTVGGDTDGKEAVPQNGNYSISVVSGGAFSTSETQLRYGTSGTFGSLYIMENAVAKKDDGWVKIPVCVSSTSSEAFSVDWYTEGSRSCVAASGRLDWPANSTATKYIEIPLDRMAEAVEDEIFTVTLTFTRGINLNQSRKTCLVTLYDTVNALKGVHVGHAESGWAELHRVDNIANTTWPIFAHGEESIAYSTRWGSSDKTPANVQVTIEAPDGQKETVLEEAAQSEGAMAWNTDGLPFGRYTLQHRVTDAEGGQLELLAHDFIVSDAEIHDGAVASNETWSASRVHVVRGDISVKNGVTLTIEAGAIVKFIPGTGLATEGTGECIANGVTFTHIADDQMGGDTLYDGGLMTPELGAFWFAGNITTDAETEFRYATAKEISANITADTVWDSHTVYHVTKSIQVRSPATLTIRKGAVVKFADRVALTVNSGATLNAQGTRAAPVVFTSIKDDTAGGDSNGDGDATEPVNGIWDEICNNGTMNLSYAVVRYGGYGQYSNQGDAAIRNGGGTAILNGCTIEGSDLRLLNCTGGKMDVSNTILRDGRWGLVGGNVSFVNGIIADCTTGANGGTAINTIFYGCPTAASGTTVKNSIAFECDAGTNGMTVADPLFDEEKGGWRIQKNSPCIDAGDETTAPAVDYFGQTRIGLPDVGLHEAPIRPVPSDIDLVAVSISASPSAVIGKTLEVTWTVENIGTENVGDSWRDVIEFIDEDGVTVELGRLTVSDGLMAGGRLTKRASFRVPSVNPGNVRLRLKVNAERDVPEGSQTGNNVIYAETTIAVVLPSIADDDYSRVTLAGGGSTAVRIPAGSGVSAIRLNGGENISAYAGAGYVPVALRYDVATFALSDGSYLLVLPKNADEKDFNITLQNTGNASETVNLETLAGEVSVLDVFPSEMSNTGLGYLTLYGIGMDRVTGVKIEGVSTRTANDVKVVSPGELTATVDMVDATEGNYSIVLETENDGTVRTAATIAVYRPKKGPKLEARLEIPDTVRQGRIYTGKIIYSNVGDAEMLAPFMRVVATDAGLRNLGSEDFVSSELAVMGIAPSYPAGIILPGETCEYEFEFKSGAAPRFMLHVEKDDTEKWEDLSPRLSEAATILNQRGRAVYDFSTILDYAESCRAGTITRAICGRLVLNDGIMPDGTIICAFDSEGNAVSCDEVDEKGVFILDGLLAGDYVLKLISGGVLTSRWVSLSGDSDVIGLQLNAMRDKEVCVSLIGLSDEEWKYANVRVMMPDGTSKMSSVTNESESAVFSVGGASYVKVIARTSFGGAISQIINLDELATQVVISFDDTKTLCGKVTDMLGNALSDAVVKVFSANGVELYSVRTDAMGVFVFYGMEAGGYFIECSCDGFSTSNVAMFEYPEKREVSIALVQHTLEIAGTCPEELIGGYVKVKSRKDGTTQSVLVDESKAYSFRVESGEYAVFGIDWIGNRITSVYEVTIDDQNAHVDLSNASLRKVKVYLRDSGNALCAGEVTLHGQYEEDATLAIDDASMGATFNVPNGLYYLRVKDGNFSDYTCVLDVASNISVTVSLDEVSHHESDGDVEETTLQNPDNTSGIIVSGCVSDDFGNPMMALVRFENSLTHKVVEVSSSKSGYFAVTGVPEEYDTIHYFTESGCIGEMSRQMFEMDGNVVVCRDTELAELSLRIYDAGASKKPLFGACVTLTDSDGNAFALCTDNNGYVRFKTRPAQYELSVSLFGETVTQEVVLTSEGVSHVIYGSELGLIWQSMTIVTDENKAKLRLMSTAKDGTDEFQHITGRILGHLNDLEKRYESILEKARPYMNREYPIFVCEHNLKVWNEYCLARKSFLRNCDIVKYGLDDLSYQWWGNHLENANDVAWMLASNCPFVGQIFVLVQVAQALEEAGEAGLARTLKELARDIASLSAQVFEDTASLLVLMDKLELTEYSDVLSNIKNLDDLGNMKMYEDFYNAQLKFNPSDTKTLNKLANLQKKIAKLSELKGRLAKLEKDILRSPKAAAVMKGIGGLVNIWEAWDIGNKFVERANSWHELEGNFAVNEMSNLSSALARLIAAYKKKYHYDCGEGHFALTIKYDDDHGEMICPYVPPTRDPNEVAGPLGVGGQRFVKPGQEMEYFVYFENAEDVDGTVLDVYVTNPLSEWLDWNTFSMGELVFCNQIDHSLEGEQNATKEVPQNGTTYFVRNSVALDKVNGVVKVEQHIFDKTTKYGDPADPYAGILPPNDETGRGEGHFSYKIKVKDNAPVGIVITNSATIVFDYNDPIVTDPYWWNTVAEVASVKMTVDGEETTRELIVGLPYGELPVPAVREGHTFGGWWTAPGGPNGGGRRVRAEDNVRSGDSGLYEYWLTHAYEVKFVKCEMPGGVEKFAGVQGVMSSQAFEFDQAAPLDECAYALEGHSFVGWTTNGADVAVYADGQVVSNLTAVSGATVELYAMWDVNSYTVTFDYGHDGRKDEAAQEYGTAIVVPDDVVREGYAFAGWLPTLSATVPASNVTYVAQWVANEYTVTFDANGGVGGWTRTLAFGDGLDAPSVTRDGHDFAGWSPALPGAVPAHDATFVAQWTPKTYSVTFDANGGAGGWSREMSFGAVIDVPVVTREGHVFAGWLPAPLGTVPAEDVMFVAQWEKIEEYATVTILIDGAEMQHTLVVGQPYGDLPEPTKVGYVFGGWFTGPDGTGRRVTKQSIVQRGDSALYAFWLANAYTVRYDANGGSGAMSGQAMEFDAEAALDECAFAKEGHSFAGWALTPGGAAAFADGATVLNLAEDSGAVVDLFAVWVVNSYTVTFDANGGEGGWSRPMEFGEEIVAPDVSREGYVFVAWKPALLAYVPAQDVAFAAQWVAVPPPPPPPPPTEEEYLVVTLDANGGALPGSPRKVVGDGKAMGNLPTPALERHEFAGWFTAPDGGVAVDSLTVVTANITIYAHWTKLPPEIWPRDDIPEDEAIGVPQTAASIYDGCVFGDGGVAQGTIQVKVGKPKLNKKTGVTTAKATATIQMLGEKKVSVTSEIDVAAGEISAVAGDGRALVLVFTENRMLGEFGGRAVEGSRNAFVSKDKGEQAAANAGLAKWLGPVNVAWPSARGLNTLGATVANKGKVKVAGTLADGTKLTGTAQIVKGEEWFAVPVLIAKKTELAFTLWLGHDGQSVEVTGLGEDALAGKPGALESGAKFDLDADAFAAMVGDGKFKEYLPDGVDVTQTGAKWVLPKAGKLVFAKGSGEVDAIKAGVNPSALKLSYTVKTGSFKGSFKAYVEANGKVKALSAKVAGVMIRGIAYGTAIIKNIGSIGVKIE